MNLFTKERLTQKTAAAVAVATAVADAAAVAAATATNNLETVTGPSGPDTRVLRRRKRQRGKPKANAKGAGRRRSVTPRPPTSTPTTPVVVSPVRVPFLPRIRYRRPSAIPQISPGCTLVMNTRHNIRSDLPHMPKNSTCTICYLQKRVRFYKKGFTCDKCNQMMCPHCFRELGSHGSLSSVRTILRIP